MKKELIEIAYQISEKYEWKQRPQNVENQIKRFYENKNERKLRYELVILERIIAYQKKLFKF